MKIRLLVSASLLVAAASSASAQGKSQPDARCTSAATEVQDACQTAVDLFNYMMPQLGTALAGGNATLGQPGSLGGLGHFSLGFRATAVQGSIPRFNSGNFSLTGATSDSFETKDVAVPMPAVDLAVGVFKGIPLGITSIGGLDALVSASYIPEYGDETKDPLLLRLPSGSLKVGYGARLALLKEGTLMPGVAVTYIIRGLPIIDLTAVQRDTTDGTKTDSIYLRKLDFSAKSWRVVASKKLLILGLAAGYGMDTYDASADIGLIVKETCPIIGGTCTFPSSGSSEITNAEQKVTRSNLFANLSLNLLVLKLTAEVGQVSGGDIATFNEYFDKDGKAVPPDKTRQYASVGFRIGF